MCTVLHWAKWRTLCHLQSAHATGCDPCTYRWDFSSHHHLKRKLRSVEKYRHCKTSANKMNNRLYYYNEWWIQYQVESDYADVYVLENRSACNTATGRQCVLGGLCHKVIRQLSVPKCNHQLATPMLCVAVQSWQSTAVQGHHASIVF